MYWSSKASISDIALALVSDLEKMQAITECFGQLREVSLLLAEEVAVGDYLLIQAGGFAFERLETEQAEAALALMDELMALGDDERSWGHAA